MKMSYQNFLTLKNRTGLRIVLSPLGASIYKIYLDDVLLTMSPEKEEDFLKENLYYGRTIGIISNRVKDGLVKINDREYHLFCNEPGVALHGGKQGLSNKVFDYRIVSNNNMDSIIFLYNKRDLEDGLPGNILYEIRYDLLMNENRLNISFKAISDKPTIIALTNHTYFTLGDDDISKLELTIPSSSFIEPDKNNLVPTLVKEVIPCLDFRNRKPIVRDIDNGYLQDNKTKGYDHHFIFDNDKKVILENDRYLLTIDTDFTGVQIYSDNYLDTTKVINSSNTTHRAVAIEPSENPLHREVAKQYSRYIKYEFIKKE